VQLLAIGRYLEDLVYQIAVAIEFDKSFLEEFYLHIQVHAFRPIQTDQTGMEHYVGLLPAGAGSGRGAAEIDRVLSDERPIAMMNGFSSQSLAPVLPSHATWEDSSYPLS